MMRSLKVTVTVLTATAFVCVGQAAERVRPLYDETFFQPTEVVETPHLKWAKPYYRGPVRALFITHRNAMREVIELAQRMSLDYTVFAAEATTKFASTEQDKGWTLIRGNSAEEMAERLRGDLAQRWDVIVIGNLKWDELPMDCRYLILKQVSEGTGLVGYLPKGEYEYLDRVLAQPREEVETLARDFPFQVLPAFSKYESFQAFSRDCFQVTRLKEGRIAFLRGFGVPKLQMMTPGPGGEPGANQADYDYHLALAIRMILWGAQKEPEATIELPAPEATRFDRSELPTELPVIVASQRPLGPAKLRLEVRDRSGRVWHEAAQDVAVAEGNVELALALPRLPHGSCLANMWLEQGGKIVNFATAAVQVTSDTHLAEVTLDRESFSCSEPVTGKIAIANPQAGLSLALTVRDNFGRLVAEAELDAGALEVPFSIETPRPLTIISRLRAELRSGDELLDVREVSYPVHDLYMDRSAIKHIMWQGFSNDFISPYLAREFYARGIDTQYTGFSPIAPQQNLWHLPYATRFIDTKTDWYRKRTRTKEDLVREPCLTDPEYREQVRERLTERAEVAARYSTSDFSLGDENHFVAGNYDLCFSPTCVADFREWCEQQYGTIARLNTEWASEFKSFDEVMPATLEQAQETGNFAPWVDHRLHMESVWADIHDFSRSVIREVVPDARVGYEGSDVYVRSFRAADYWKLSRAMDLNNIYYRDFVSAAWHDFAAPDMLFGGGWFGGYAGNRNEPFMRWFPWRTLFKGANSFWVWMGHGNAGSVMAFDLSLYPFFEAACEEVNEIKAGTGKMLVAAERQHDGIALLYSPSSVHAATFTQGFPSMNDELNDAVKLLHDLGLECRVLSYAELAEGKLTNEDFKALLLPCAQALSEVEVQSIKAFAEAGGAVIADLRPAVCDEHGKPYEAGALDELFGVKLDPAQFTPASGDLTVVADQEELDLRAAVPLTTLTAEAGVEVTAGKSLASVGEAPALIAHEVGQGRAILLNFALAGYGKRIDPAGKDGDFAGWAEGETTRALLRELMQWAGVRPPVALEPGQPLVEISRFRSGTIEYVGIVQALPRPSLEYTNKQAQLPGPKPVTIRFDRISHVYDVRARKYLGETDAVRAQFQPGRALLYALLPYRVASAGLAAPQAATQGNSIECTVAVNADSDQPAAHAFHVRVSGPDGAERPYYASNLLGDGGRASGQLTFALDDAPGTWMIEAVDIATGATATAAVQLSAR